MISPMCKLRNLTLLMLMVVLLAACGKPTPIPIFVTPTPSEPTATATGMPTLTPTETPTLEALTGTPTPAASPIPTVTFGPVIPPDYTLPPTETPLPSVTPTLGTPTPSPTPPPRLDGSQIGIQIHPRIEQDEWRQMLGRAQELGVGWIKVQFPWDEMEPDGTGSQSVHWRELELYSQNALMSGFRLMVSITKAPDWARPTNEENGPPSDPQTLGAFIAHILDRFGPAIAAIEVWNEPNLKREWTGSTISGGDYMRYFDVAYDTITAWSQANGHPIQIVTAGLAPTGTSEYSVDDRVFLRQMYQAGLANYPGIAVGIHPYAWGNAPLSRCCDPVPDRSWDDDPHFFFLDTIEAYREILVDFGQSNTQLWVTEFGWATYDGFGGVQAPQPFFDYVTEVSQAAYTIDAINVIRTSGNYNYVGPMILWNLNFGTIQGAVSERREEQAGYSLLRPDYSTRPLYMVLRLSFKGG